MANKVKKSDTELDETGLNACCIKFWNDLSDNLTCTEGDMLVCPTCSKSIFYYAMAQLWQSQPLFWFDYPPPT